MDYFSYEHKQKRLGDVRQFMTTFHQPFPTDNPERQSWLRSEFLETMDAVYDNDEVGVLDGYIDFEYVACGMELEIGRDPTDLQETMMLTPLVLVFEKYPRKYETILCQAWDAVHRANMRKRWYVSDAVEHKRGTQGGTWQYFDTNSTNHIAVLHNGKVVKPPGWVGPEDDLRKLVESLK